jgi:hypothetical protein
MKAFSVSARAKTLNELLKKARRGTVILQSADGQRFALTSVHDWEGFDVGEAATISLTKLSEPVKTKSS